MKDEFKTIWMYWHQGWENAPKVSQMCLKSWQYHNPTWKVMALDETTLKEYCDPFENIENADSKDMGLAAYSDILRTQLLLKHGGVWADSTTFCTKPLDSWLSDYFNVSYFAFCSPIAEREMDTWFLASLPGHYINGALIKAAETYWNLREKAHNYFWYHQLFNFLCQTDDQFKNIWALTPKYSCDWRSGSGPHAFRHHGIYEDLSPRTKSLIDNNNTPLYKLSWRIPDEAYNNEDNVLNYLFKTLEK